MISATRWVRSGVAAEYPVKVELDDEELKQMSELAKQELQTAREDLAEKKQSLPNAKAEQGDELEEYHMEDYDENMGNIVFETDTFAENEGPDQYLTQPTEEDLAEEREELRIPKDASVMLAAKTEDESSVLEVHVFGEDQESQANSLYVHHDIMLPSFALCLESILCQVGNKDLAAGNYVAIGTLEPEIEVWNLDEVEGMYPAAILGSSDKKKKKNSSKIHSGYHVDAVISLSANPNNINILASGSADTTVKLWDLTCCEAIKSLAYEGKISSVLWNPQQNSVLGVGGYDGYAHVCDLRLLDSGAGAQKFKLPEDVESIKWSSDGIYLFVATDQGNVYKFDTRSEGKPLWQLKAHDGEITSFDLNIHVENYMVTGSMDKHLKLWNLSNDSPSMLVSRDFDTGKIFSVGFCPDYSRRGCVSIAGSRGGLKVWNTFSNRTVREAVAPDYVFAESVDVVVANNDSSEDEDIDEYIDQ